MILTGMVRSGKTTTLKKWLTKHPSICGVLTPDMDGKRVFVYYPEMASYPMECDPEAADVIEVGSYCFSSNSFNKVNQRLIKEAVNCNNDWILIDEIGPLELEGKGLYPSVKFFLDHQENSSKKLLLVVREKLVGKVIKHFSLSNVRVILKEGLEEMNIY